MIEYTAPFFLIGEAGRTLDATPRTLDALGICNPVLVLASLAMDTLTFTIPGFMVAHLPDDGQWVTLRDSATPTPRVLFKGRLKRGWSLKAEVYTFRAESVWKQLTNAPLKGISTTRPYRVYPSQGIGTTLANLISVAGGAGLDISAPAGMPTMYNAPQMTLRSRSYAEALATVLQMVPDAGTRMDYNHAVPRLTITRRGTPHVIDVDAEDHELEDATLELQEWRRALGVTIHYAERTSHKEYVLATQTGGDPDAETSRVISLMMSGFERTDPFSVENLNTAIAAYNEALGAINAQALVIDQLGQTAALPMTWDSILSLDTGLQASRAVASFTMTLMTATSYSYHSQYYKSPYNTNPSQPEHTVTVTPMKLRNGAGVEVSGRYPIRPGTFTDAQLAEAGAAKETLYFDGEMRANAVGYDTLHQGLEHLRSTQSSKVRRFEGYTQYVVTTGTPGTLNRAAYTRFYFYRPKLAVTAINKTPAQVAAILKGNLSGEIGELDEQTAFLVPPPGFAQNYFEAQDYTPLTGQLTFRPDAGWKPGPGDWVRVSGTRVDPMWMVGIAPISQVQIDLGTGRLVATAGFPARQEINSLLDAIRFAPEDNWQEPE